MERRGWILATEPNRPFFDLRFRPLSFQTRKLLTPFALHWSVPSRQLYTKRVWLSSCPTAAILVPSLEKQSCDTARIRPHLITDWVLPVCASQTTMSGRFPICPVAQYL